MTRGEPALVIGCLKVSDHGKYAETKALTSPDLPYCRRVHITDLHRQRTVLPDTTRETIPQLESPGRNVAVAAQA